MKYISSMLIIAILIAIVAIGYLLYQIQDQHNHIIEKSTATITPVNIMTVATEPSTIPENWKTYTFPQIGLTFAVPSELFVISETPENIDTAEPYAFNLYIQNYQNSIAEVAEPYQLYGIYQWDSAQVTPEEFMTIREELINPVDEITDGLPVLSGQIKGERGRWATYILRDGYIFKLLTSEPTEENRLLTKSIIQTFKFSSRAS